MNLPDPSILRPIAVLGPDLTATDWAKRLNVPLDDVLVAFRLLKMKPAPEPGLDRKDWTKADRSRQILECIERGCHTTKEIAKAMGMHETSVRSKLNWLVHFGLVLRSGETKSTRWVSLRDRENR